MNGARNRYETGFRVCISLKIESEILHVPKAIFHATHHTCHKGGAICFAMKSAQYIEEAAPNNWISQHQLRGFAIDGFGYTIFWKMLSGTPEAVKLVLNYLLAHSV